MWGDSFLDGKKMNSTDQASYDPSLMTLVGLETGSSQKQQLWDWETTTQIPNTTTTHHPSFLANTPFLNCPTTSLLPMNSYPYYSAITPEEYHLQAGLIKSEEDRGTGQIGLNLGHRTYFSSGDAAAIDRLFRRSRGLYQMSHHLAPRCQAEGCKADLSGAKNYHRRHKVCEFHSKATVVVVAGGLQQRFCQQCSRFHVLSEFDEAKRSCRKRLADHNRRRRKPQTPITTITTTDPSAASQDPTTTTSTEKSKQTTLKSTRDIATTKRTSTTASTISTSNRTSRSLESPKGCQNKETHLRNDPALSLGGADRGGFGFHASLYHHQRPLVVMSDEKYSLQQQQQQQQQHRSPSSSSSSTFFHPHNFFCSRSDEASQLTTGGGGSDQTNQHNSNPLHLGQGMFEVDFI